MTRRRGVMRWQFSAAIAASMLLGAEIVFVTAARSSAPGRLPAFAGALFIAAVVVAIASAARLEWTNRRRTALLVDQLGEALSAITALTEASLASLELPQLLDRILDRLVRALHTEVAVVFLADTDKTGLHALAAKGIAEERMRALEITMADDDGLVGRVVVTETAYSTSHPENLAVLAARAGVPIVSAAACPILVEGRLIGVCVAATAHQKAFDEREVHLLQLVADRSGLGIEQRRLDAAEHDARRSAERARRYALVLAGASTALATSQDSVRSNVDALLGTLTPEFCDWCAVDVVEDGRLVRVATAHGAERDGGCADELARRVPELAAAAARVCSQGRTESSRRNDSDDEPVERGAFAWIVVPASAGHRVVGTVSLVFHPDDRVGADSLATAEDVGRRVAVAIERTFLVDELRSSAERSRRVAAQIGELLDSSLEVSRIIDASAVASVMAARALTVCAAHGAVVTISDGGGTMHALARPGEPTLVGEAELLDRAELPRGIETIVGTQRTPHVVATPIVGPRGAARGAVMAWRNSGPEFEGEDEAVLVLLAQTAATALASVDLYRTIQASEARWRTLIEAAPIGVMEVDARASVEWANPAAIEILGDPRGERGTVGPPVLDPAALEALAPVLASAGTGDEARDRELLGVSVGSVTKDLLVSVVPLEARDGEEQGALALVADVSTRRRLELELRQAQRVEAVGQLAGTVAHDFNNLLTLISGYTELLQSATLSAHERDLLDNIQGVTDRAALLTGRLLTISRRQAPRPEPVNPVEALSSMHDVLARILGDGIALEYEFDDGDRWVSIDPGYFDQVVLNLALNARDAMPTGGRFAISVRARPGGGDERAAGDGAVEIVVRDTGTGMEPETLAHCFDPFFTTKGPSKGTGLGLAAAKGVVVESGGSIEAASVPGEGTSFRIVLPLEPFAPRPAPLPNGQGEGAVVLVAEDDEALRAMISKVLAQAGYVVESAADGVEARDLARARARPVDLLVTDVSMPGLNGPELVAAIDADAPAGAVLYISNNTAGIVVPADRRATTSFLAKPFLPSALIERVEALLRVPQRRAHA